MEINRIFFNLWSSIKAQILPSNRISLKQSISVQISNTLHVNINWYEVICARVSKFKEIKFHRY
jgi:hypothetical protein